MERSKASRLKGWIESPNALRWRLDQYNAARLRRACRVIFAAARPRYEAALPKRVGNPVIGSVVSDVRGVGQSYCAVEVAAAAGSMMTVLVLVAVRPFWSVAT